MNLELKNEKNVIAIYTEHSGKNYYAITSYKEILETYIEEYYYSYEIFTGMFEIVDEHDHYDLDDDEDFKIFTENLKEAKAIFDDGKMLLKITGNDGAITKLAVTDHEAAEQACIDYIIDDYDGQSMKIVDVKNWREVEKIKDYFGSTLVDNLKSCGIELN